MDFYKVSGLFTF